MTYKPAQQTPAQQTKETPFLEKFPSFPPRDDMQNSLHLDDPAHQAALTEHFGNHAATIVLSEIPVRLTPSQQAGHRIPDLLIAFNTDRSLAVEQNGYSIQDQGKPPDFVLEIASAGTAENDYTHKRLDYAAFRIPEYWRFDPTGGRLYGAPIAGDQLRDAAYQPIEILEIEPEHFHGHSSVLNLCPCSDHGQLRWYDPLAQQHLMTFAEERAARISERAALLEERAARAAAEARVRDLEEKLRNTPS